MKSFKAKLIIGIAVDATLLSILGVGFFAGYTTEEPTVEAKSVSAEIVDVCEPDIDLTAINEVCNKAYLEYRDDVAQDEEPNTDTKTTNDCRVSESEQTADTKTDDENDKESTSSSAFDYYVSLVPANVREHLYASGWTFTCMNDADLQVAGGFPQHILAFTEYDTKKICISENDQSSVIHEIGHAMDGELGFISHSDEAFSVYSSEKSNFVATFSPHPANVCDTEEYFAEAFDMYVRNGSTLQSVCPETYGLITSFISQM